MAQKMRTYNAATSRIEILQYNETVKLGLLFDGRRIDIIDLERRESLRQMDNVVGYPYICPDGSFLVKQDAIGTVVHVNSADSASQITIPGYLDGVIGKTDDDYWLVVNLQDTVHVVQSNVSTGLSRIRFGLPIDEEWSQGVIHLEDRLLVKTTSFDGVRLRDISTGHEFVYFPGTFDYFSKAGRVISRRVIGDGVIRITLNDLTGNELFHTDLETHKPVICMVNSAENTLLIRGGQVLVVRLWNSAQLFTTSQARIARFSQCGDFIGLVADEKLYVLNLDDCSVRHEMSMFPLFDSINLMSGGKEVLLDNRLSTNSEFQWELRRIHT